MHYSKNRAAPQRARPEIAGNFCFFCKNGFLYGAVSGYNGYDGKKGGNAGHGGPVRSPARTVSVGRYAAVRARLDALAKLHEVLKRHEGELLRALAEDLGKSPEEAYMTEMGVVYDELRFARRRLRAWSLPRFALPSVGQFPGYGLVRRDPYGLVLILSPWNYPLQLCLAPLIAAVAAGNCVVARPSSQAPRTAQALAAVVSEAFAPDHVSVALGDAAQAETLVRLPFDKIFFTGSPAVGRRVMAAASENLTPVTLELGGKSPAIVAADADVALAARRIVFGKTLNAGQTCVAPDYVLVARGVENALLDALRGQIRAQFGPEPLQSPDLARIVNRRHFERLSALLSEGRLICGGQTDPARLKIAPTVLFGVPPTARPCPKKSSAPFCRCCPFLRCRKRWPLSGPGPRRWRCTCLPGTGTRRGTSWPTWPTAADASTTASCIWPIRAFPSAAWARAGWAHTTARRALTALPGPNPYMPPLPALTCPCAMRRGAAGWRFCAA